MSNEKLHMPNSHTTINNLDILNTLAVSKYLKKFKFTEIQAEALSNVLKKNQDAMISHQDMEDRLATKSDIGDVKLEIQDVRSEIQDVRSEIQDVKSELKDEIQELRSEVRDVKSDIKELRSDTKSNISELKVSMIKWQVGIMLVLSSLFISLTKF